MFGNAFVATSSSAGLGTTEGDAQFLPPIGSLMNGIRACGYGTHAGEDVYLFF